jgi:glutathione S-transferase
MPIRLCTVNLKTRAQKTPHYLAINRYGQVPALSHRGLTIVNSNVILDYLARVTGKFDGDTEQDRWRARMAGMGDGRHQQRRQGALLQPVPQRRCLCDRTFPSVG